MRMLSDIIFLYKVTEFKGYVRIYSNWDTESGFRKKQQYNSRYI